MRQVRAGLIGLALLVTLFCLLPAVKDRAAVVVSPDVVYPPDSGVFDVKKYGAAGDGVADDTAAIRRAMADGFTRRRSVIYFPAGTYRISDTLWWATDGAPPARAVAHVDVRRGCVTGIGVQNGGHGYVGLFGGGPGVILEGGGGWGATAWARLAGDSVADIELADGKSCSGSGYTSAPAVRVVNFQAWLGFQGQNESKTRIRLEDHAPGFGNGHCVAMYNAGMPGEYCKAMLFAASSGASNPIGAGESSYFTDIEDMTIDSGTGNPAAMAIDWAASNTAAIRNVTLTGNSGRVGLNTSKGWSGGGNGPALIGNLTVDGYDYGIVSGSGEVGLTFEHIVLRGQRIAGLWNRNQNIWIRDLRSGNSAPAIVNEDNGSLAIVDSKLDGGSSGTSAILNTGVPTPAHLYARNVSTSGYASAIRESRAAGDRRAAVGNAGVIAAGPRIGEFASDGVIAPDGSAQRSLNLPVRETPAPYVDNNFAHWAIVTAYGAARDGAGDSTGPIQAALNSGKPTVFLPSGSYRISGTLYIPDTVRRVIGVNSEITIPGNKRATYPVFSCEAAAGGPIEIRSLAFDIATVGYPSILNRCSVPLVVADVFDVNGYENQPGKGLEVYFENAAIPGGVTQHGGNVWARQLDVETDSTHVLNDGANFWVLGYKTEGSGSRGRGIFYTENGGSTEVIGAFNATPGHGPYDTPAYTAVNSRMSIAGLSSGLLLRTIVRDVHGVRVNTCSNNGKRYGGAAISLYTNAAR